MGAITKTLSASCHCQNVQYTITVPAESLPLQTYMCHCSICRYTHGAPCCFHTQLPVEIQPEFIAPSSLDKLTTYEHPQALSTRHFCSNCGCQVGDRAHHDGHWVISSSIFDANKHDQGIWQFHGHVDPTSPADGGLSALVSHVDGKQLEMITLDQPLPPQEQPDRSNSKELLAQCHCGGVSFTISRPSAEFIASPVSQGWLHPSDKSKWLACWDLCNDCRLVNGTHVVGWMFVPLDHISPPPAADFMIGSSKSYRSSEGVSRTFCCTCGATVSYSCKERPHIVDVAVGILRAPEGVMAENWAAWRAGRPAWPENGLEYHEGFARALTEGAKRWGLERGHPADFVIS